MAASESSQSFQGKTVAIARIVKAGKLRLAVAEGGCTCAFVPSVAFVFSGLSLFIYSAVPRISVTVVCLGGRDLLH